MGPKIIITPFGGHGTVYLYKRLKDLRQDVCIRPDYIFSEAIEPYDLDKRPIEGKTLFHQGSQTKKLAVANEWRWRTGIGLNHRVSIRSNLLSALHRARGKVILFGKCSLTEPFLTNEELNAMCIVRHPLYTFDSFFGSRHPQWVWHKNGIESSEFIEWYFKQWSKIVDDFASSGNPILKYEQLVEDTKRRGWTKFSETISPMWKPTSQCRVITEKGAKLMYDMFHDSYTHYLYDPDTWMNYKK